MGVKNTASNKKDASSSIASKCKSNTVDVKRKSTLKNATQRNLPVSTSSSNVTTNVINESDYVVCYNCKSKTEKKKLTQDPSTIGTSYLPKRTYGKEIMGFMPLEDYDAINPDIEYIINLCTSGLLKLEIDL